jgi:hypothetical protein
VKSVMATIASVSPFTPSWTSCCCVGGSSARTATRLPAARCRCSRVPAGCGRGSRAKVGRFVLNEVRDLGGWGQEAPMSLSRASEVVSSSGVDGHGLERVHKPRCACLRRFRVDPPARVDEAVRTTRKPRV